jgi:DNA-binding FadR family transcriptional regulator
MPIESIDNRRLYRQIAEKLSRLIEAGEFKPGDRLPAERVLAEKLNVSRPTVREALIALEVEGYIDIRGGAGVFVLARTTEPSVTTVSSTSGMPMPGPFELLFARDLIEPDVAALAAKHATSEHLAVMSQALSDMICCSAGDVMRLEYDRRFHFAIAEASGNSALVLAIQALWLPRVEPVYLRLEDHFHSEQVWQRSIMEHREILEAIKHSDTKAARAAMHRHLKNARTRFASKWEED